jgi:hypothetical protein
VRTKAELALREERRSMSNDSNDNNIVSFMSRLKSKEKAEVASANREIVVPAVNLMLGRGFAIVDIVEILRSAASALESKGSG